MEVSWGPLIESRKILSLNFPKHEEWCKIWRGSELSFQNWHGKFDKFWPEHLKVSKIFTLICSFWAKYILFEVKKYRGVIFMTLKSDTKFGKESTCGLKIDIRSLTTFDLSTRKSQKCSLRCAPFEQVIFSELEKYRRAIFHGTEDWCKIWRKTELQFGKWHEEFDKFSPEHLKVSKLGLWWHPFVQSIKCVSLKFTEEFCVSWKWRMMQSLKRNWLIISKLKGIEECWP